MAHPGRLPAGRECAFLVNSWHHLMALSGSIVLTGTRDHQQAGGPKRSQTVGTITGLDTPTVSIIDRSRLTN